MPPKPNGRGSKADPPSSNSSTPPKPLRRSKGGAPAGGKGRKGNVLRRSAAGLAPRQAIREWLLFAQVKGYRLVTGQRQFNFDLDRVNTLLEEEKSLYEFCRHKGIGSSEQLTKLREGPATREGFEHRVFFHLKHSPPRVTKITFPGRYGRIEHTPFLYLERLALSRELFPVLDVRFEDCVITNDRQYSIISSMQFFSGPPPTQSEIDKFLTRHGFSKLSSSSLTMDYTNGDLGIHLRDCHPKNWVKSRKGLLIPIDIVPERIV
jgi:hypothetical protein